MPSFRKLGKTGRLAKIGELPSNPVDESIFSVSGGGGDDTTLDPDNDVSLAVDGITSGEVSMEIEVAEKDNGGPTSYPTASRVAKQGARISDVTDRLMARLRSVAVENKAGDNTSSGSKKGSEPKKAEAGSGGSPIAVVIAAEGADISADLDVSHYEATQPYDYRDEVSLARKKTDSEKSSGRDLLDTSLVLVDSDDDRQKKTEARKQKEQADSERRDRDKERKEQEKREQSQRERERREASQREQDAERMRRERERKERERERERLQKEKEAEQKAKELKERERKEKEQREQREKEVQREKEKEKEREQQRIRDRKERELREQKERERKELEQEIKQKEEKERERDREREKERLRERGRRGSLGGSSSNLGERELRSSITDSGSAIQETRQQTQALLSYMKEDTQSRKEAFSSLKTDTEAILGKQKEELHDMMKQQQALFMEALQKQQAHYEALLKDLAASVHDSVAKAVKEMKEELVREWEKERNRVREREKEKEAKETEERGKLLGAMETRGAVQSCQKVLAALQDTLTQHQNNNNKDT